MMNGGEMQELVEVSNLCGLKPVMFSVDCNGVPVLVCDRAGLRMRWQPLYENQDTDWIADTLLLTTKVGLFVSTLRSAKATEIWRRALQVSGHSQDKIGLTMVTAAAQIYKLVGYQELWQSNAQWPLQHYQGEFGDGITRDAHPTRQHAESVCVGLNHEGFGGERRVFPIKTWVTYNGVKMEIEQ